MNDFERRLSQQVFRDPPADLRAQVLGAAAKVVAPESWTWRDWLWPSPTAWGALAALWLVFAALSSGVDRETAPAIAPQLVRSPEPGVTLLSFHHHPDLTLVLELPN